MEQNDNMPLAANDFGVNAGSGDVDPSLLQAFLENNDYEPPNHEPVDIDWEANLITSTIDYGDAGNNQSGADAAFEQAIDDVFEGGDADLFGDDESDIDSDDLFGSDVGLDEVTDGDAQRQLPMNYHAPALPPAASQQPVEVSQDTASPVHTVAEQDEAGATAFQNSDLPEFDFDFDFNADPSSPNFDLNDLLPLEEHDLPTTEPELLAFAAQNPNYNVNQTDAEFGMQWPEPSVPENPVAQEAWANNAEAVLGLSDEQLAELLQTDLSNLPSIYDETLDINTSAVAFEQGFTNNPPFPNLMNNEETLSATLPELSQHGGVPGVVSDNAFFQSNNVAIGECPPSNYYTAPADPASTNAGPSHITSPAVRLEIPAQNSARRRSRDEFENDDYFAPQPSQPLAKKSRQHYEQVAEPGGPNIYAPSLNLPQQTLGGNASSGQPGVPVITPVELPPRQAAEAQRPGRSQYQRPPVQQPPAPPAVVLPQVYNGYQPLPVQDRNWGVGTRGRQLFQYTDKGEWVYGQVYTARQIKKFICGENRDGLAPSRSLLTIWIQSTMNGNKNRYPQPVKCRWDDCPVKHRTITQGQYRVCFDEHADTSGRTTDPFHNTGYMHLYCFERCAPLISLIKNPPPGMVRVKPDDRRFPNLRENGNPMQLGGSSAAHSQQFIETYNTWVEDTWPKWQNNQMTSRDTLYYTLADLHLRMFPNRQTTTAHLRDYMGDLDRMQELRDQKGRLKRKRDRDDDDDEEEEERPRQRAKTQDLGQPQSAAPLHPQQHVGNGYQTSGHGQAAGQPATNGPSQPFDQPQPRPAQNPARYDGYTQVPPPAPIAGYKRRRTDDDDGTCESGRQQEYGSSAEPHTPKRVKVSIPSAPNRQHNSRYSRSSQPRIPAPRFQPVPQRPVNLPMLDDPFVVDPRFQVDPVLSAPSINLNLSPNPNFNPDVSSSYADPMAVPGLSTDFLAPEQGVTQPAQTPTRYSEPSDIDIENWTRGTSSSFSTE